NLLSQRVEVLRRWVFDFSASEKKFYEVRIGPIGRPPLLCEIRSVDLFYGRRSKDSERMGKETEKRVVGTFASSPRIPQKRRIFSSCSQIAKIVLFMSDFIAAQPRNQRPGAFLGYELRAYIERASLGISIRRVYSPQLFAQAFYERLRKRT